MSTTPVPPNFDRLRAFLHGNVGFQHGVATPLAHTVGEKGGTPSLFSLANTSHLSRLGVTQPGDQIRIEQWQQQQKKQEVAPPFLPPPQQTPLPQNEASSSASSSAATTTTTTSSSSATSVVTTTFTSPSDNTDVVSSLSTTSRTSSSTALTTKDKGAQAKDGVSTWDDLDELLWEDQKGMTGHGTLFNQQKAKKYFSNNVNPELDFKKENVDRILMELVVYLRDRHQDGQIEASSARSVVKSMMSLFGFFGWKISPAAEASRSKFASQMASKEQRRRNSLEHSTNVVFTIRDMGHCLRTLLVSFEPYDNGVIPTRYIQIYTCVTIAYQTALRPCELATIAARSFALEWVEDEKTNKPFLEVSFDHVYAKGMIVGVYPRRLTTRNCLESQAIAFLLLLQERLGMLTKHTALEYWTDPAVAKDYAIHSKFESTAQLKQKVEKAVELTTKHNSKVQLDEEAHADTIFKTLRDQIDTPDNGLPLLCKFHEGTLVTSVRQAVDNSQMRDFARHCNYVTSKDARICFTGVRQNYQRDTDGDGAKHIADMNTYVNNQMRHSSSTGHEYYNNVSQSNRRVPGGLAQTTVDDSVAEASIKNSRNIRPAFSVEGCFREGATPLEHQLPSEEEFLKQQSLPPQPEKFICWMDGCEETFLQPGDLFAHMSAEHNGTHSERCFSCPNCGLLKAKSYKHGPLKHSTHCKESGCLRLGIKLAHDKNSPAAWAKEFCNIDGCTFSCNNKQALKEHQKTVHSNVSQQGRSNATSTKKRKQPPNALQTQKSDQGAKKPKAKAAPRNQNTKKPKTKAAPQPLNLPLPLDSQPPAAVSSDSQTESDDSSNFPLYFPSDSDSDSDFQIHEV